MSVRLLPQLGTLGAAIAISTMATACGTGQPAATTSAHRASDGHPDLQGIWTYKTTTPLERPARYAGRELLTDEELKEAEASAAGRRFADTRAAAPGSSTDVNRAYDAHWSDRTAKPTRRTSLLVDPPDGRLPPLTPEAKQRMADWAARRGQAPNVSFTAGGEDDGTFGGADGRGGRADNPEDRSIGERCITRGGPRLAGGYNANMRIVQNSDYVIIEYEMIHDARVIPLDGRPHLPSQIRQYVGDSRGRWEGDTLVVDTTNFTDKNPFRGSFENLHVVERLKRVDASTIEYTITFEDPTAWVRPWTAVVPLVSLQSLHDAAEDDVTMVPQMFEFACHEANYSMAGSLRGQRARDRGAEHTKRGQ